MRKLKSTILVSLLTLVLSACTVTEDTSIISTTSDDPSTTTTSTTSTEEVSVASVLAKLQEDSFSFDGDLSIYANNSEGSLVYSGYQSIKGYYSNDRYVNIAYDDEGYDSDRIDYYKNAETGYIESRYLDPTTNETVVERRVSSTTGEQVYFDSLYYNPWWYVEESDGTLEGDIVTFTLSTTVGYNMFGIFTNYGYTAETATVHLTSDGEIDYVLLETGYMDATYYGDPVIMWCTYLYEYISFEEVGAYSAEPREATSETQALQDLFDELKKGNYTADVTFNRKASTSYFGDEDYTFLGRIISTENAFLVVYVEDNVSTNVTNGEIEGYVTYSEGYYQRVVGNINDNSVYNTDNRIREGDISQFQTQFTILAEMFDYVGNNQYVYANYGQESYLYLTSPDYEYSTFYYPSSRNYPDVGSFTFTLNDDGTASIDYTLRASFGYYMYITVHVDIYDIGSTSVAAFNLTLTDPAGSWSEVSGAYDVFDTYGLDYDEFPFFDQITGVWSVTNGSAYAQFRNLKPSSMTIDETYEYIDDEFTGTGWVYQGQNLYGEYMYTFTRSNGLIVGASVTLDSNGYVYIYIYNALSTWLFIGFGDTTNPNYTLTTTYSDGTNSYTSVVEVDGAFAMANGTSVSVSTVFNPSGSYPLTDATSYESTLTNYDSSTGIYTFDISNNIVRTFYYSSRIREDYGIYIDSDISSAVVTKCELDYTNNKLTISISVGDNITIDFTLTFGSASIA